MPVFAKVAFTVLGLSLLTVFLPDVMLHFGVRVMAAIGCFFILFPFHVPTMK